MHQCAVIQTQAAQAELPEDIAEFIRKSTGNYGKVKLVLLRNKYFVESPNPSILKQLLEVNPVLHESCGRDVTKQTS